MVVGAVPVGGVMIGSAPAAPLTTGSPAVDDEFSWLFDTVSTPPLVLQADNEMLTNNVNVKKRSLFINQPIFHILVSDPRAEA
ncbi:unannotated protein [freshwater metagenome]|uniref:Unannotated protein n=1 Tax=freshwater metagenome TaxID=449393 RepID=A0A6J7MRD1_9ZZZZ